jgi:uncharacterized membrane-anchored protein
MDKEKEKEEISLIGRLFSLEAMLILMGLLTILSGIIYMQWVRVILGLVILSACFLLLFMRKYIWEKRERDRK